MPSGFKSDNSWPPFWQKIVENGPSPVFSQFPSGAALSSWKNIGKYVSTFCSNVQIVCQYSLVWCRHQYNVRFVPFRSEESQFLVIDMNGKYLYRKNSDKLRRLCLPCLCGRTAPDFQQFFNRKGGANIILFDFWGLSFSFSLTLWLPIWLLKISLF